MCFLYLYVCVCVRLSSHDDTALSKPVCRAQLPSVMRSCRVWRRWPVVGVCRPDAGNTNGR